MTSLSATEGSGAVTLVLRGELDSYTMFTLRDEIFDRLKHGDRHLRLDLTGVTRCEATVAYGIAGLRHGLRAARGDLDLTGVSGPARRALAESGLENSLLR